MDATRRNQLIKSTIAIAFALAVLCCNISCTVDNDKSTPNSAFACNPTAEQINAFKPVNDGVLAQCVVCHDGTQGPQFLIGGAALTDEEYESNLCAVYRRGQLSPSVIIFNYPQSDLHDAASKAENLRASFQPSELVALKNWITSVVLPF